MLQGKYLRFAIRFILTEQCHLPLVVQHRVSTRFGLLVYLGTGEDWAPVIRASLGVGTTTRGNPTTLPTSNPPSLHLSSHHPPLLNPTRVCSPTPLPNMENHTQIRHNPAGEYSGWKSVANPRILGRKSLETSPAG